MKLETPPLPEQFVARMQQLLGDEAAAFLASYELPAPVGLRVNMLKLRPEHLERITPWDMQPLPWCTTGFLVDADARPGKHPYHAAGLYYLQEPSAMAVVEALQLQPGLRVLDLSASPGGKATHIASALDGNGLLVANEIDQPRVKALGENLERWGVRNAVVLNETPERLAGHFGATFDRVLLDAPCSGEGMFRRRPEARREWSAAHVAGCALRQERILEQASRLTAPGGLLMYSTCTFAPEENEARVAAFLDQHTGWELINLPKRHGIDPGRPEWADPPRPELVRAARLWPHKLSGDGHWISLLRAPAEGAPHGADPWPERGWREWTRRLRGRMHPGSSAPDNASPPDLWNEWQLAALATKLPEERIRLRNDQLYLLPEGMPQLGELRVVRAGLWLGTLKPGRFEPSHALALALVADDVRSTTNLAAEDAAPYLRGETLPASGSDGWTLVLVDGWPLGWGKQSGGIVKNFYPKGLRQAG